MDLRYAGSERSYLINYKKCRDAICGKKTGSYAYEYNAPKAVSRIEGNSNWQAAKKGPRRGSDAVAKTQHSKGQQKNSQGQ